ncbi:glycosyltransferase family 4 protein [Halosimplex halobium]|uniref:glycosyltransferase family 4 protein n=1 Tax=Halosimplex halobium TaxID=3396618 RepID=UPI003F55BDEB
MTRICFVSLAAYGYFVPDTDTFGGGAQRQLSLLARELTADFDVHFVVGDYGQPEREVRDGVVLHRSYRPDPESAALRQPVELAKLLAAMRRADADIYVYRGRPWKATLVYLLARVLRKRMVYNLANDSNVTDGPDALPSPARWLFERTLKKCDGIIAQTDRQATFLAERFGVESTVVPNGYPPITDRVPHDDREYFLWVGRLDGSQKRPHLYLDLAERLPDTEFRIAGPDGLDADYSRRVRQRAADLENVNDLGVVDPEEIHRYFRDAIALVNTSAHEGFPNTFLEAWRFDTPVVSLDVDPSRFVSPDINGFARGDHDRLVGFVERLHDDVAFRRELGRTAGKYVRENLSIERVAEQYARVIRRAAES